MFRKRLVLVSLMVAVAVPNSPLVGSALAQEVIDLDEAPAAPKKGGAAKPAGGAKKGGVDIDLDEGQAAAPSAVTAGQMTESAAAAKQLFDKEGIDFEQFVREIGGLGGMPGMVEARPN